MAIAVAVRPVPRLTADRDAISPELSPVVVVLSIPSWPKLLLPQHLTEALSSTVQVCSNPGAIVMAVLEDVVDWTVKAGIVRILLSFPSASVILIVQSE